MHAAAPSVKSQGDDSFIISKKNKYAPQILSNNYLHRLFYLLDNLELKRSGMTSNHKAKLTYGLYMDVAFQMLHGIFSNSDTNMWEHTVAL